MEGIGSTVRCDHDALAVDDNRDSVDVEGAPHIEGVDVLDVAAVGTERSDHNMDSGDVRGSLGLLDGTLTAE